MPVPASSLAGPIWSKKMNGPIVVRSRWGRVRWTLNPPRSWVVGSRVWRKRSSAMSVSFVDRLQHVDQVGGEERFVKGGERGTAEPAPVAHHPALELGMPVGRDLRNIGPHEEVALVRRHRDALDRDELGQPPADLRPAIHIEPG